MKRKQLQEQFTEGAEIDYTFSIYLSVRTQLEGFLPKMCIGENGLFNVLKVRV